jgi:hypothetical protein
MVRGRQNRTLGRFQDVFGRSPVKPVDFQVVAHHAGAAMFKAVTLCGRR